IPELFTAYLYTYCMMNLISLWAKALLFPVFLFPILLSAQEEKTAKDILPKYILATQEAEDSTVEGKFEKAIQLLQEEKYRKAIRVAKRNVKKQASLDNWYYIQAIAYQQLDKED